MEAEDWSALSLLERWTHAKWNARQSAYKEATQQFETSPDPNAECFAPFLQDPQLLKSAVSDSNAAALDAGIRAVIKFYEFSTVAAADHVCPLIFEQMCEKGLVASKPSTRQATIDAILMVTECVSNPGEVIECLVAVAQQKPPKLVQGGISALVAVYTVFGARAAPSQPALKLLPALFGHTDRNVRAEATKLACVLAQYLTPQVVLTVVGGIKPVQIKELQDTFAKLSSAQPERTLRSQRKEYAPADRTFEVTMDQDPSHPEIDPYDLLEPVEVLSKFSLRIEEMISSSKWKERKEALEELAAALKTPKMAPGDYTHLVDKLERAIAKDANIMCTSQAILCVKQLALGLRTAFSQFVPVLLPVIVERFKEKKANVIELIHETIIVLHGCSSLSVTLPVLLDGMANRVPQVKIESAKCLGKILCAIDSVPSASEVKHLCENGSKLILDTQEPVRREGANVLGIAMKLVGERAIMPFLSSLDDIRKAKVKDASVDVTVKAKSGATPSVPPKRARATVTTTVTTPTAREPLPCASSTPARPARLRPLPEQRTLEETPKKAGVRTVNVAEFTPARQPPAARRRLVSPARPTRIPEPRAEDTGERLGSAFAEEVAMLRREKVQAELECAKARAELQQERIARQAAETESQELAVQVDTLRQEVSRLKRNLELGQRQHDGSLDNINTQLTTMSLQEARQNPNVQQISRRIQLGAPRSNSRVASLTSGSPSRVSREKSQDNWKRAGEVTGELKKRIEMMKRQRGGLPEEAH